MSTLTLVRHGQATPFDKVKDRLSSTGEIQARKLGEFWVRSGRSFDRSYSGSLVRQRRTVELIAEEYDRAGLAWPATQIMEELNEYDVERVLNRVLPDYAREDPGFRVLLDARERSAASPDHNRHFQRLFEAVMIRWIGEPDPRPDVEPWTAFRDRVRGAMRRIMAEPGSGRRIAVITSGGPVGVTVQMALGAPDRAALELNWRVRNCSLTEFVFTKDRFSLDHFNGIPHLEDAALWTHR